MNEQELAERIEEIRDSTHDDETRGFVDLIKRAAYPRLAGAGWILRFEGEDGLGCLDHVRRGRRIIHSIARELDGEVWAHVSVSRRDRTMPTWEQTRDAWWLIYDQLPGVIVVAPPERHVNKAEVAHIWGCLTRQSVPDFTHGLGTI